MPSKSFRRASSTRRSRSFGTCGRRSNTGINGGAGPASRPSANTICGPARVFSIHMQSSEMTALVSGTVEELIENERIVTSGVMEMNGAVAFNTRLEVSFAEHAGKTSVTVRHTYWKFTGDRNHVSEGANAGWAQQMDRLDAYLRARV